MNLLKRYKYHCVALVILFALAIFGIKTRAPKVTDAPKDLPRIKSQGQLEHALELVPRKQQVKFLSHETKDDLRPFILQTVRKSLPEAYRESAFEIARSIISEANHHHMDPLFLMAVIATESQFNPKARGTHGEIGLMQILPKTAKWIAPQAGIARNKINLEDPATNIRIGATYFAKLRKTFSGHGTRYVSAYNMGSKNVHKLLKSNREPRIYSTRVIGNYTAFYARIGSTTLVSRRVASTK
jgi:soluble lytic murein transglycosylase